MLKPKPSILSGVVSQPTILLLLEVSESFVRNLRGSLFERRGEKRRGFRFG